MQAHRIIFSLGKCLPWLFYVYQISRRSWSVMWLTLMLPSRSALSLHIREQAWSALHHLQGGCLCKLYGACEVIFSFMKAIWENWKKRNRYTWNDRWKMLINIVTFLTVYLYTYTLRTFWSVQQQQWWLESSVYICLPKTLTSTCKKNQVLTKCNRMCIL